MVNPGQNKTVPILVKMESQSDYHHPRQTETPVITNFSYLELYSVRITPKSAKITSPKFILSDFILSEFTLSPQVYRVRIDLDNIIRAS